VEIAGIVAAEEEGNTCKNEKEEDLHRWMGTFLADRVNIEGDLKLVVWEMCQGCFCCFL
jgi:hypothetical protein